MDGYTNNIEVRGGLMLDIRLNNNYCIDIFNSYSHKIQWESLTFISDEQEIQYWKTFHEEINEAINKTLSGEWSGILGEEIYKEMSSLYKNYRQNEWLWVIKDGILSKLDGTTINIIETFGANSSEAETYRVGNFE